MSRSNCEEDPPDCVAIHKLINQLSAIVGNCSLLEEDLAGDLECLDRLHVIQEVARLMTQELRNPQFVFNLIDAAPGKVSLNKAVPK